MTSRSATHCKSFLHTLIEINKNSITVHKKPKIEYEVMQKDRMSLWGFLFKKINNQLNLSKGKRITKKGFSSCQLFKYLNKMRLNQPQNRNNMRKLMSNLYVVDLGFFMVKLRLLRYESSFLTWSRLKCKRKKYFITLDN